MGRPREQQFVVGQTYGEVRVVAVKRSDKDTTERYKLRCVCGKEWWKTRPAMRLRPDALCHSCATKLWKTGDGRSKTPLYKLWRNMHARCINPAHIAYKNYGARGITVCKRWSSFDNFRADVSPRPDGLTLERIDNSKGYSPSNCRWASRKEQNTNKRTNRMLTVWGETQMLAEWARRLGTKPTTIWLRLEKYGWSVTDACTVPVRKKERK